MTLADTQSGKARSARRNANPRNTPYISRIKRWRAHVPSCAGWPDVFLIQQCAAYLVEVRGAPAPEGTLAMNISADGIIIFRESNNPSDFAVTYAPFDRWLEESHPEDFHARIRLGGWDSVSEAEQAGTLRARYADEWATYLNAKGCTYRESDC